jgi:hypothetical protein
MSRVVTENADLVTPMIDQDDSDVGVRGNGPAPIVLPPSQTPAESAAATPHSRTRVLPRLLAMADTYYQGGSLRQAIELYFELVRTHAGTPQARQAEERLLEVARAFEVAGEPRQARGIYEQLL